MDLTAIADSLKALAIFLSILTLAWGGFTLITSDNPQRREEWKEIIAGVFIGLSLLFLSPLLASFISGGTYCGG